jgi:hypothetical protein
MIKFKLSLVAKPIFNLMVKRKNIYPMVKFNGQI